MKTPATYFVLLFALLAATAGVWGQVGVNLVPNPSFEDFTDCPESGGQISFANFWNDPTLQGSTDYFNSCGTGGWETPDAIYGPIIPRTGSSCAAIVIYPGSEFLQTQLSQPLIANKKYFFSFYVYLADSSMYSANNIGAYLSSTEIVDLDLTQEIPFVPQIENLVQNNLASTGIWFEISDTIVAAGDEQYLVLGNFDSEANTVYFERIGANWCPWAIYYIDDVTISEIIDTTTIDTSRIETITIPNLITPNGDGINEALIPQTSYNYTLIIYDRWGNVVFIGNTPWQPTSRDVEGIYFYVFEVQFPTGHKTRRSASVTLLR